MTEYPPQRPEAGSLGPWAAAGASPYDQAKRTRGRTANEQQNISIPRREHDEEHHQGDKSDQDEGASCARGHERPFTSYTEGARQGVPLRDV
jgi:hypothetical protein